MAQSYYYREGRRVPVILAESAGSVRLGDERAEVEVEGWRTKALTSKHTLMFSEELLADRAETRIPDDLGSLSKVIANHELALGKAERGSVAPSSRMAGSDPWSRPDLSVFPVAIPADGKGMLFATGDVIAQFPTSVSAAEVQRLADPLAWVVVKPLSFLANGYLLRATTTADPFGFANTLVEKHGALFAHPAFLEDIPERQMPVRAQSERTELPEVRETAETTLVARQWHLRDIDAVGAWQFTRGSRAIVVCVMDSGVNLSHEAFQDPGKLVPGYDFEDDDANPSPTASSHGTACAALAAAGPDPGQVLGVAPHCRLMPIRRPGLANHLSIAEAFSWAADHGADVISCSFGADGRPWVLPDVVRSAFDYATSHGRQGRGCAIFWAAGNGSELVSDDEWASSRYTIAVAASTDQGRQAPYSDFGPEISICAPSSGGINGIVTAVNIGYTAQFGGTSASAPIAAGVGCLVLSVAPHMRWFELRDLLQQTARKIDPASGGYDSSGHSIRFGWGQVDALQALLRIDSLLESERSTGTVSLDPGIQSFLTYLNGSAAGRVISAYVAGRRLGVLLMLQSSDSFRAAAASVLRLLSDCGEKIAAGQEVSVPEDAWPAIETAVRSVLSVEALGASSDRTERSINLEVTGMPTATRSLDDALERISSMLGGSTPVTPPPAASVTPLPTATTSASAGLQREEIARQIYYSSSIPAITHDDLLEMEKELPAVIELLGSLSSRPAAQAELMALIEAAKAAPGSERADGDQARLEALGARMVQDAFSDTGERVAPIGIGIALFMAAYTVVKQWRK